MSGVVFKIIVPTEQHEIALVDQMKRKLAGISQVKLNSAEGNERKTSPKLQANEYKSMKQVLSMAGKDVVKGHFISMNPQVLETVLKEMKIYNSVWDMSSNKKFYQITFPVESRGRCEEILNVLKYQKIGRKFGSIVTVIPCNIYYCEEDDEEEQAGDTKNAEETER